MSNTKKIIVIDAGHYGNRNQSPIYKKYFEAMMTWILALALKTYLIATYSGLEVILTRNKQDVDKKLYERGYMAKGSVMFLSLHSNACGDAAVDRPVVITTLNASKDVKSFALMLGNTIHDIMGCKNGAKIATRESQKNKGAEYYGVLRGARAAGCLCAMIVEHGFHTNLANAKWLFLEGNLKNLAQAEGDLIASYLKLTKIKPIKGTESVTKKSLLIQVIVSELNVRKLPDPKSQIKMKIKKGDTKYTIVETKTLSTGAVWGKLKSGAGWINISEKYVKKI